METKINNQQEYQQVMDQIEVYLKKATAGGGFASLTTDEADELERLSLQVQAYEADLGPIPFATTAVG